MASRDFIISGRLAYITMASATFGLAAGLVAAPQIADLLALGPHQENLVRAAFVGLWAQMNYEQLTSLFRVEERSVAYVAATLANVLITVAATILLVVVWHKGALGVLIGAVTFSGSIIAFGKLQEILVRSMALGADLLVFLHQERVGRLYQ